MRAETKIAFGCYFTAVFAQAAAGAVYLLRQAFMPYHAVAAGMPWRDVPASLQVLILALMRIWGGASIILALALFILLFIPFREGQGWAFWAVPLLLLTNYAAMSYAMAQVDLNTSADPPWAFVLGGVFLTVTACVLTVAGHKKEVNPDQRKICGKSL